MAINEFWIHGTGAIVEFPDIPVETRRTGRGTLIRQRENTANWFHFALPSIETIENQSSFIRKIHFRATVNENARVDRIHFRSDRNELIFSQSVSLTDREIDETFQTADTRSQGGLY